MKLKTTKRNFHKLAKLLIFGIIIMLIFYFFIKAKFNNAVEEAYSQGALDASAIIYQNLFSSLSEKGMILFRIPYNDSYKTIMLVPENGSVCSSKT